MVEKKQCLRGEEAALASQDGNEDVVTSSDLVHRGGQLVVQVSVQGIELFGLVEGDDGNLAAVFDGYAI